MPQGLLAHELTHTVQQGESLSSIGKKYGHQNLSPIYYHPKNRLKLKSPDRVQAGSRLTIPPTKKKLSDMRGNFRKLKSEHNFFVEDLISKQEDAEKKLSSFCNTLDFISSILTANVGLVAAASKGNNFKMSYNVAKKIGAPVSYGVKQTQNEKKDHSKTVKFLLRAASAASPSFWTEAYMAVKEGDVRFITQGKSFILEDVKRDIGSISKRTTNMLNSRIREIDQYLSSDMYRKQI